MPPEAVFGETVGPPGHQEIKRDHAEQKQQEGDLKMALCWLLSKGCFPAHVHAEKVHRKPADAHHQAGVHTGGVQQKQQDEKPKGLFLIPLNQGEEQGRGQIGGNEGGDIPVELGAHPGPPSEGGQIPQSLKEGHLPGCHHKDAEHQNEGQIGGSQPLQPSLHEPQGILISLQGVVDAKSGEEQKYVH